MIFNAHSALAGKHATISASKYHWVRYSNEKFLTWVQTQMQAAKGSRLHNIAALLIKEGLKMPRNSKTLNMYVNDCIGYRMTPEQVLFYSFNAFGTADAISYRIIDGKSVLRIFDLKTGISPASFEQLIVYVAFFCLEYEILPREIDFIELRIYQNDDVVIKEPSLEDITVVMDRIVTFDRLLNEVNEAANA